MPIKVKIDGVGRIRIPKAFRDALGINHFETIFLEYYPNEKTLKIFKAKGGDKK